MTVESSGGMLKSLQKNSDANEIPLLVDSSIDVFAKHRGSASSSTKMVNPVVLGPLQLNKG